MRHAARVSAIDRWVLASLAAVLLMPSLVAAQGRVVPPPGPRADTVVAAPGPRYAGGWLHRLVLGSDWRTLWQLPIPLPVLHPDTFAGGLEPDHEGGGQQSVTLHLNDRAGRQWIFRSVDKNTASKLEVGGLVQWIEQDQVSALHPAGQLVVAPLLQALGVLHVSPTLYVMPSTPVLGKFRQRFGGMIGALEPIPNEGPHDTPGTFGSKKIVGTDAMFKRLRKSPGNRVDEHEFLRARLLDFMIDDVDRGPDQWRWARFPDPARPGDHLWRPIPRDRDWAFYSGDGLIGLVVARFVPKNASYRDRYGPLAAYTYNSHVLDRRMLTSLSRADVDAEVARVRASLTDSVIAGAVARLPTPYPASHRRRLIRTLEARRERLPGLADAYYRWLADAVDVRATDQADRADVVRHADGSVEVSLSLRSGARDAAGVVEPYYHRIFDPAETHEVRIYLRGGDDVAVVRGASDDEIAIRVIGDAGDDVLADSTSGEGVHFYDARGHSRFLTAAATTVSTKAWYPPAIPEGISLGSDWAPDFGHRFDIVPAAGYGEYAGVIAGAGVQWTKFGFRRLPHRWQLGATALLGLAARRPAVDAFADWRPENSLHSLHAAVGWSGYDAIRWYGLGNDTPRIPPRLSLVPLQRLTVRPDLVLRFGTWRAEHSPDSLVINTAALGKETPPGARASLSVGPVFVITDPEPRGPGPADSAFTLPAGAPYDAGSALGSGAVYQAGAGARFEVGRTDRDTAPRRGYDATASVEEFPDFGIGSKDAGPSGDVSAVLRGYLPVAGRVTLAARLGAEGAFGDFTAWNAAAIGGRATLRGYRFMRFAGDAATWGNLELRAPVATIPLIVTGELGVVGLADAGRVWYRGASPGGFHTAFGGGLWFAGAGHAVSVYYAHGDEGRVYASVGMPF